jgi:DNA-binding GntR family transcriptional regulator
MAIGVSEKKTGNLQEKVYHSIRKMIIAGKISHGDRIVERKLAEQVGASRVPVREALLRLNIEGIVTTVPSGGYQVRKYTLEDLRDLYETREAIEGFAARLAAERAKDVDIEKLDLANREFMNYSKVGEEFVQRSFQYDELFHQTLLQISGNKKFVNIFEILSFERITFPRYLFEKQVSVQKPPTFDKHMCASIEYTAKGHDAIVNAIREHDGDKAEKMMRGHIQGIRNFLQEWIDFQKRMESQSAVLLLHSNFS